jgi:hypothetical protein
MAAPPSTASPASWNPAVPPPPVTGAAVGYGVYVGLGDGVTSGVGLSVGDSDGVGDWLALSLALALAEVLALAVLVAVAVELAEPLALGGKIDTDEEGPLPPPVQAASETHASAAIRPQPTVSLTRCAVHAMAVRALIRPPRAPGNDHFPVADRRNRAPGGNRVAGLWPPAAPGEELPRRKRCRA